MRMKRLLFSALIASTVVGVLGAQVLHPDGWDLLTALDQAIFNRLASLTLQQTTQEDRLEWDRLSSQLRALAEKQSQALNSPPTGIDPAFWEKLSPVQQQNLRSLMQKTVTDDAQPAKTTSDSLSSDVPS